MTNTLITGANKGLGFAAARRLIAAGHNVWIGARDPERGQAAATALGARFVPLDVTDDASVGGAAELVREKVGRLDVLINNAGINAGGSVPGTDMTFEDFRAVFDVNVFGVVRVTHAFLPLLRASEAPSVINVSSGLGSFHQMTETEWGKWVVPAYSASKSALTMLTIQYANALPGIRFNAVDPGWTPTDTNGNTGPQTVEEGTDAVVRLAAMGVGAPTATFTDRRGTVPW
ncbi:SDR family NAD(P)-dependent oxidoreductase [Actinoplanes bogorensis]|uniref:SDR family NAD(P)-dependent oxidoreductase n=1 Tax=Paractinoplanes bogorensis TaxID=1610840 RepID=A0ABS5Z3W3_9ACTN|nr:SDR family NAD(P)-dependent oxidoreductase [Actinoplanes bogorensis]MBU2669105.1 SDR family NAD(P)-dependent oxidoreductase [Actinoplanes bogorensis]